MSFMEPQMTGKILWIEYDSNVGGGVFPMDVLSKAEFEKYEAGDYSGILKYTEASKVDDLFDVRSVSGYGVRLSAPGYMDATEWEVFTNRKDAEARIRELEDEISEEDED